MCRLRTAAVETVKSIKPAIKTAIKPELFWYSLSGDALKQELDDLGLTHMYLTMLDGNKDYWFTSEEDFTKIKVYIREVFKMPVYETARMDCEDFAMLVKGLISAFFGYNATGFVVGPGHSWMYVRVLGGWKQQETQAILSELHPLGYESYNATHILA